MEIIIIIHYVIVGPIHLTELDVVKRVQTRLSVCVVCYLLNCVFYVFRVFVLVILCSVVGNSTSDSEIACDFLTTTLNRTLCLLVLAQFFSLMKFACYMLT